MIAYQTNGLTERFNRTLTDMLAKRVGRIGIHTFTFFFLFSYRVSVQKSVKESLFYLLYDHDPWLLTTLEVDTMSHEEIDVNSYKREVSTKLAEAYELAKIASKRARE